MSITEIFGSFGPTGKFYYQIINHSRLLGASKQYMYNIVQKHIPQGSQSSLHMEVFDHEGAFMGTYEVPELSTPESARFRHFLHIDDSDRLFIADFFDDRDPRIQVYQIGY